MASRSSGFTLLEMLVVITLIGFLATMVLPRLIRRPPSVEWPHILNDLNNLVFFARQEAISNYNVYRLRFKSLGKGLDFVVVEIEKKHPEKADQKIYERVFSPYFSTRYELSEHVSINAVYLGKEDLMSVHNGEGYCYVISDGLVQDVYVHLTRRYKGEESRATFKMMPFLGEFEYLEGHKRPGKE